MPWLLRFVARCNGRDHLAGFQAVARLAGTAMERFDELERDGVAFTMQQNGLLIVGLRRDVIEAHHAALAPMREFGYEIPDSVLDSDDVRGLEPTLERAVQAGLLIESERSVDPRSLVEGLARQLTVMGVPIHTNWPVRSLDVRGGRARGVCSTKDYIAAAGVVVAAGSWSPRLLSRVGVRIPLIAGRGYSFTVAPPSLPRRSLYLSEAKVGVTPLGGCGRMRLAGTMELARVSDQLDRRRLDAVGRGAARYLRPAPVGTRADEWAGMRPMTSDGIPVIGRLPTLENGFVATGHGMLGITLGPSSGHALATAVLTGEVPEVLRPFAVERFARSGRSARNPSRRRGSRRG